MGALTRGGFGYIGGKMTGLGEYLGQETLRHMAHSFSAAAGAEVWIVSAEGAALAGEGPPPAAAAEAKVLVGGRHVGSIVLAGGPAGAEAAGVRLLGLMRDVLARLCEQAGQLRARVEELAAMYRLTEVFAGRTELNEIHQLAAETMVTVTGADACSIRVLNDDRTELVTIAAHGLSGEYMSKGPILLSASKIDQEVLATGQCVYIADEQTDPRVLYPAQARREGIVSALCAR